MSFEQGEIIEVRLMMLSRWSVELQFESCLERVDYFCHWSES